MGKTEYTENGLMILSMPRTSFSWKGAEGVWIMAGGWANAGKSIFGDTIVLTTDGSFTPAEILTFPRQNDDLIHKHHASYIYKLFRKYIPEELITLIKDIKLFMSRPKSNPIDSWNDSQKRKIKIIFERHDLFSGAGRSMAKELNIPFVLIVDAPVVWEAEKWGVRRPFWGKFIEYRFERTSILQADVIVCVSEEVKEKILSYGVSNDKIIVCANRADPLLFNKNKDGSAIEAKYNLRGKKVIGWVGSFRRFHGLEIILRAFAKIHKKYPETLLLLVGDGQEKMQMEIIAEELKISDAVIFTGKQFVKDISKYLVNFHIALLSANSGENFHYSPLKLQEYLATGRAVIAPRVGNLTSMYQDNVDLLFYEPADVNDLIFKIELLLTNETMHRYLQDNAIKKFEFYGGWENEMNRVCQHLGLLE